MNPLPSVKMARNNYGTVEDGTLPTALRDQLSEYLAKIQLQAEVPVTTSPGAVWKVKPESKEWYRSGWVVQRYHLYDWDLDDDDCRRLLILDHFYDGSHPNQQRHVNRKQYLTFSLKNGTWTCTPWNGKYASAITRLSKTEKALEPGYLLLTVTLQAATDALIEISGG